MDRTSVAVNNSVRHVITCLFVAFLVPNINEITQKFCASFCNRSRGAFDKGTPVYKCLILSN